MTETDPRISNRYVDKEELGKMVDARGKLRLGNCLGDPLGEGETPTTLVLGKISDP